MATEGAYGVKRVVKSETKCFFCFTDGWFECAWCTLQTS